MRLNLKVPFAAKEEAKKLGARWDAARKIWYVEGKDDVAPFSRWSPTTYDDAGGEDFPQRSTPAQRQQATGKLIVGSDYVERTTICLCLPWEVCDKCWDTALNT